MSKNCIDGDVEGAEVSRTDIDLSIVAPVYNEAATLNEFFSRLVSQLQSLNFKYEIILVNDGSTDASSEIIERLSFSHPELIGLEFTRNFGHQFAISAGLAHANGKRVIIMDSDLQDPPEVIPKLLERSDAGFEVVYGVRRTRKENFFKKFCYYAFYRILKLFSSIDIPPDSGDFCVITHEVVHHLVSFPERNRFLRGLRSWVGYRQCGVEYDRDARFAGKPKYTIRTLVKLALDGLVSFSYRPLRAISILGMLVSLGSFALAVFYLFQQVQFGLSPPGFASTMVAIFFFSGLQLVTLGIIGEYIGRIYEEVKRRPHYLIRRVVQRKQ
ncbi:MAG: glycosyltransferase family 2 protein [Bdellovibrionales bacterium]|nr:glycosyltransferase family 2 protein [Bdellovibrionales bacterium]